MKSWAWLVCVSVGLAGTACGGGDTNKDNPDAPGGGDIDAPVIDPPDAAVPVTLTLTGKVQIVSTNGVSDAAGELVELKDASGTVLASATSGADANFTISFDTTTIPVDGYIEATQMQSTFTPWTTFVEPPEPVAEDLDNVGVFLGEGFTWTSLVFLATGSQHVSGNGILAVVLIDDTGAPLQGATITTSTGGTIMYPDLSNPTSPGTWPSSTGDGGLAVVFHAPAGPTTISGSSANFTIADNNVTVRPDAITSTVSIPQ